METKYSALNELKIGSFILIDNIPCRVVSMTKSKPGKHGAAKIRLEAIGLIDDRRRSIVNSSDARVEVPIIEKRNAQIISVTGDKANAMDLESYETFDIDIPAEFKDKIAEGTTVLYWDVGVKQIKGIK